MTKYADRTGEIGPGGVRIWQNQSDRDNEAEVSDFLSKVWSCELRPFGMMSPIDWFAIKNGCLSAVLDSHTDRQVLQAIRPIAELQWQLFSCLSGGCCLEF